jgi:hypothetical protein
MFIKKIKNEILGAISDIGIPKIMDGKLLSAELRQILQVEKISGKTLQQIDQNIQKRGAAQMLAYLQVAAMRLQCQNSNTNFAQAQDQRIHDILKLLHECT